MCIYADKYLELSTRALDSFEIVCVILTPLGLILLAEKIEQELLQKHMTVLDQKFEETKKNSKPVVDAVIITPQQNANDGPFVNYGYLSDLNDPTGKNLQKYVPDKQFELVGLLIKNVRMPYFCTQVMLNPSQVFTPNSYKYVDCGNELPDHILLTNGKPVQGIPGPNGQPIAMRIAVINGR